MFKSPLGNLCFIIGFIWAMFWWGKFTHWSSTPVVETRDRYFGKLIKREENYDIMEQGFAKIIMPLLGHFVIEPIIYAAIIYYPIQCVIALVGAIFPYILSLIVLAIIIGAWLFTRDVKIRYRSVLLILCGLVFTLAFDLGGYAIMNSGSGSTIQMLTNTDGMQVNNGEIISDDSMDEHVYSSNQIADENFSEQDIDDQFDGYGEEGLLGGLPTGTTEYEGDLSGYPIEFIIIKEHASDIKAIYKNVNYGTTMNMNGESLPSMGGDISFYGNDGDTNWVFNLTGDVNNITGTAQSGNKELKLTLKKK